MNAFWQHISKTYPDSYFSACYWQADHQDSKPRPSGERGLQLSPLSQYGFLAIEGPDCSKFLQGQTTCDWRAISTEQASLGSYCNIKGRMVISFIAGMASPEAALLRLHADTAESGRDTLGKYIVFSKAKIRNASDERVAIGISGKSARQDLQAIFNELPSKAMAQISCDKGIIVQLDEAGERFEYWGLCEHAISIWQQLSPTADICSADYWEALNIAAGIGEVCASSQDMFIPQMLNYQVIGGVSFSKGCYTGQEVVARMQYRGKLKRRLYKATLPASGLNYPPGTELFGGEAQQSIGNLVSMVSGDQKCELLAVLTEDAVASGEIHFANSSALLSVAELPYAIPSKE
ncbi:MAG: folate-binding protein YgfZ [Zhongshania aliphaticivorans]|jgi:folate-binding protein YgfZ|uniref:CAF17-like 4Fe-4S cluster assembly/insertion protein YgfZ n=1 Tax=Zhongshania aliphaticivorans TaxID=1470434 RepID=UPI0039E3BA53